MRLTYIIGLGNPGGSYERTRHNAGFLVVDLLAKILGLDWKEDAGLQAATAKNSAVCLVKPLTFMNDSGRAARAVLSFYEGSAELNDALKDPKGLTQVILAYDDLDIGTGEWKKQFGRHPKVHNGVNSVIEQLGTDAFWNMRIGVDSRNGDRSIPPDNYVLTNWTSDERSLLASVLESVVQELNASIVSR